MRKGVFAAIFVCLLIVGCFELTVPDTGSAEYTLTVKVEGQGTVTPSTAKYKEGEKVKLEATPESGWEFTKWTGASVGIASSTVVTMTQDKEVTAVFTDLSPEYSLEVGTQGQGSVSFDPSGGKYAEGKQVTLTAKSEAGWQFNHWEGDITGSDNPASVTMDADKSATAVFTEIPENQYTVTATAEGQGSVSLDPTGGTYAEGTQVKLTATPADGWTFGSWSGDLTSSDNPTTISIDGNKEITAVFKQSSNPKVRITVTMADGSHDIVLELNREAAPVTVANFLKYVEDGFYDMGDGLGQPTIFHRVIPGFMIQGGGFTVDMTEKTTRDPIVNEASNGLKNLRGTIAMARTSDPDSATSQFFINLVNNDFLDYVDSDHPGYAVFGKVIEGMDVVDEIAKVKTHTVGQYENVPVVPIIITSAKVEE